MRIAEIIWWNLLSMVLTSVKSDAEHEKKENRSLSRAVDVFPGFRMTVEDDGLRIKFNLEDVFPANSKQSRNLDKHDHQEEDTKTKNNMQKYGAMLMMIPLIMQMLSIPLAIASIKMSLLKSIFVGKLAVFIMIYNLLKSYASQPAKTIVIQPQAQHYEHFYPPHVHEDSDENEKGWFGSFG